MNKQRVFGVVQVLSIVLGLANVVPAFAEDVYKCTGQDGKIIYQKDPCEGARQAEKKEIDPNRNVVPYEGPPLSNTGPGPDASGTGNPAADGQKAPASPEGTTTIQQRKRRGAY